MPSASLSHILLLTGVPGIGKTTVIRKVATAMPQHHLGGFYTEEIREVGARKGFRLVTFGHDRGVIAHVDFDGSERVGKYGVDVAVIDRLAASALAIGEDIEFYLVDEIGKMGCLSDVFIECVTALLASDQPVIATLAKKGGGLIQAVKQWPGSQLWEVTRANRDSVTEDVLQWIQQRL